MGPSWTSTSRRRSQSPSPRRRQPCFGFSRKRPGPTRAPEQRPTRRNCSTPPMRTSAFTTSARWSPSPRGLSARRRGPLPEGPTDPGAHTGTFPVEIGTHAPFLGGNFHPRGACEMSQVKNHSLTRLKRFSVSVNQLPGAFFRAGLSWARVRPSPGRRDGGQGVHHPRAQVHHQPHPRAQAVREFQPDHTKYTGQAVRAAGAERLSENAIWLALGACAAAGSARRMGTARLLDGVSHVASDELGSCL